MSSPLTEADPLTRADARPPEPAAAAVGPAARPGYRYWAFISYSHRDGDWAARIHRRLETWRVPRNLVGRVTPAAGAPVPRRLFPIFRDRDELAGGSNVDDVLKAALEQSRYLVVLCSPNAAGSRYVADEVAYFKSLGRDDRIVYVILAGDPAVDDVAAGTACFPPAARQRIGPDCRPVAGAGRVEPMAADARPGKDGFRDAMIKVKARLLDVPFDELKRREARRRRRARAALASLGVAVASLAGAAYVGVADAGLSVPGGALLRATLDRHDGSVFRRVAHDATVRHAAAKLSGELQTALRARFTKDGLINDSPPRESPSVAYIAHAQALSSLLSRGSGGQFAANLERLERLFRSELLATYPDGVKCGWINDPVARDVDSFTPLWAAIAICEALQCPEAASDRAARARLLEMLAYTQESLRPFRHNDVAGAWDAFPFQTDGRRHSVYASTVALMAVCEARRANVPWDGSSAARDELARSTSAWIVGQYRGASAGGGRHGWLNDPYEEHAADVFDGMTAQTYSALLDAQATFPAITLPASMLDDIRLYLSGAVLRPADYPIDVGEYRMAYRRPDGTVGTARETLRYLWWPWMVRTANLWLRYAAGRGDVPNEYRVQVRRTLAHLVLDLGPAQNEAALSGYSYINAENLFGLRAVGPP